MQNNTTDINILRTGMNTDSSDNNLQKGEYSFALNASIEDFDGNGIPQIQNTNSNILATEFGAASGCCGCDGYIVIGRKYITELQRTIYFLLDTTTGKSQIAEVLDTAYNDTLLDSSETVTPTCSDCPTIIYPEQTPLEHLTQTPYSPYYTLIISSALAFDINHPVICEYRVTQNGLNIYFTDDLNPLRYLYFDLNLTNNRLVIQNIFLVPIGIDYANCNLPIYGTELDANAIMYNPNYTRPCITNFDVTLGGSLKAGGYQILICYADILGNPLTHYFPASDLISIKTKNTTVETNYLTDRAITFNISNLDNTGVFYYYNVVVAETIDNFTAFKHAAILPIMQDIYIYTGNNIVKDLSSNDIFFQRPVYKSAHSITKANDYLFYSRLKEYTKLNLQQAVNQIKVYWQTKALPETVYADAIESSQYRTYQRDEVYALGIVFELIDDNDTIVFPLVPPSKSYFSSTYGIDVDTTVMNNDILDLENCTATRINKTWELYNTAQILGKPHQISNACGDNNLWEYGDFAYWESQEVYPNIPEIWGNLCNQPIRHFKFPDSSITHIHDGYLTNAYYNSQNIVYPIGIRIDHTSVIGALNWAVTNNLITSTQLARIKGYRLVRGNRVGNKSITAKGLLFDMWSYNKYGNQYFYPNYPYNDLRPDPFISNTSDTYLGSTTSNGISSNFSLTGRYTFHSPDTHFTNSTLGSILKLETEEYGQAEGFYNNCDLQPKYRVLSTMADSICFAAGIAAAFSTISKECRSIQRDRTYFSELGLASGSIEIYDTKSMFPGGFADYNTLALPTPNFFVSSVNRDYCVGTQYHWLSPGHTAALIPSHGSVATILLVVQGLTGFAADILFLWTTALREMDIFRNLILSLTPKQNYFIQYNSIGKYTNYKTIPNSGNKLRYIETSAYISPKDTVVPEPSDTFVRINNWNRESSVYIKTDSTRTLLPVPSTQDTSRNTMKDAGLSYSNLNTKIYNNISSYYASVKNYVPDQYGNIYSIDYLETSSCSILLSDNVSDSTTYFGGDTFINRFALKRKHPFFLQTRFRQNDESDVLYSELGNVGYPNFYMDYGIGIMQRLSEFNITNIFQNLGSFYQALVGVTPTRLDVKGSKAFYQEGYIHLYSYGIPYFLVESDINADFRHAENNQEKDFYPNNSDLTTWLQEKNVPIYYDNVFFYNKSYSKQNKESYLRPLKPDYLKYTTDIYNVYNGRIIYTEKTKVLSENDNWLIIKANNFYDNDTQNGMVMSVDGIEQDKVLVRNENTSQIFNAYDLIKMETGTLQTGEGGIFQSRPRDFVVSDLGYMASQNRDLLKTEFGHIWADAKRGNVFLLGSNASSIEELSRNNMRNWFKQNLPFQLKKYFPIIPLDDLDNNYKGLGLIFSFDKRFNRLFLTKLDYKPLQSCLQYDLDTHSFYCPSYTTVTIPEQTSYSCPAGYSYNAENQTCNKIEYESSIIISDTTYNLTPTPYQVYGISGTAIYDTGWSANGTGTYTMIPTLNPFWIRQTIPGFDSMTNSQKQVADLNNGPVNRLAIWGVELDPSGNPYTNYSITGTSISLPPVGEWIGFETCINIAISNTYYIALAADNLFRLTIDGVVLLTSDPTAMGINHGSGSTIVFNKLHIYPITLTAGSHSIKLEGYNVGAFGAFATEIYNNTPFQIATATSYDQLDVVFTTRNQTQFSIIDYGCPSGFTSASGTTGAPCGTIPQCSASITIPAIETIIPSYTTQIETKNYVQLSDTSYFKNISWTISYNFLTKTWVSFHSFIPNFYVDYIDSFASGINNSNSCTVWTHNITNKSYQVYYGTLYPFIVDIVSQPNPFNSYINSIDYTLNVQRFHNDYDWFYNRDIYFNKAIVYNERQCTGILQFNRNNYDDLSSFINYPINNTTSLTIGISNSENIWKFNNFYDIIKNEKNNIPIWLKFPNNVGNYLNPDALNYGIGDLSREVIRGRLCHVRYINDIYSNYRFTFFYNQVNQIKTYR